MDNPFSSLLLPRVGISETDSRSHENDLEETTSGSRFGHCPLLVRHAVIVEILISVFSPFLSVQALLNLAPNNPKSLAAARLLSCRFVLLCRRIVSAPLYVIPHRLAPLLTVWIRHSPLRSPAFEMVEDGARIGAGLGVVVVIRGSASVVVLSLVDGIEGSCFFKVTVNGGLGVEQ